MKIWKVVELLRDKGVTLELCPTSNRMTRAFTDIRTYPLRRFMKAGVKVTLNTDDPGIEGITLADEYDLMRERNRSYEGGRGYPSRKCAKCGFLHKKRKNPQKTDCDRPVNMCYTESVWG